MSARPNVVLIVLDSVRRDHLSCYGYGRPTTPGIDAIADEGIVFTRASAASCWTLPSHASLFTGLYPSHHRADLDTRYLNEGHATIASYLGEHGYTTASISCNGFVSHSTNLARGFDPAIDVEQLRGGSKGLGRRLIRGLHRRWRRWTRHDRGAARATRMARRWLAARRRDEPFFLFLNYMDCHAPYRLRRPERYRFVAPVDRRRVDAVPQDPFGVMAGRLSLSEQDLEDLKALYDGCLHYLDQQVGRLDAQLRDLGLDDRTIFIVTSDHGESFGEHGLMDHQYGLYEELLAVPLVVRLPGRDSAGRTENRLVQHVDLFPTLIDALDDGGGAPGPLAGRSVLTGPSRAAAFAEYLVPNLGAFHRRFPGSDVARYDRALRSIRTDRYKLISGSDGQIELYDLERDAKETENLAAVDPSLVERLESELVESLGPWPEVVEPTDRDDGMEEMRDRLQALGYL